MGLINSSLGIIHLVAKPQPPGWLTLAPHPPLEQPHSSPVCPGNAKSLEYWLGTRAIRKVNLLKKSYYANMISNDFWVLCYLRVSVPWHKCGELAAVFTGVTPSRCAGNGSLWTRKWGERPAALGAGKGAPLSVPQGKAVGLPIRSWAEPCGGGLGSRPSLVIRLPRRGGGPFLPG